MSLDKMMVLVMNILIDGFFCNTLFVNSFNCLLEDCRVATWKILSEWVRECCEPWMYKLWRLFCSTWDLFLILLIHWISDFLPIFMIVVIVASFLLWIDLVFYLTLHFKTCTFLFCSDIVFIQYFKGIFF